MFSQFFEPICVKQMVHITLHLYLIKMPHSSTHIFIHLVFATKRRQSFIQDDFREHVERYLSGIYASKKHSLFAHYLMTDHYHSLFRLHPAESISALLKRLKSGSSFFINREILPGNFQWQEGYGAFGIAKDNLEPVIQYIRNQPIEHQRRTLEEEVRLLNLRYDANWQLD